jgi:peroxiredoxin Q/BCP
MKSMPTLSKLASAILLMSALALPAAETPKVGDKAPAFAGMDQDGKSVKLADFAGQKNVLLYFYPKDNTPGCTKEACGLRDRMGTLKSADVVVLGVSLDSAESHKKFIADQSLNFPLLADTDGKITDLYGAKMKDRPMSRRVSFLIAKDGKIVQVIDNMDAKVQLAQMKEAVDKLSSK